MASRRVLVAGLSSPPGSRLAQALERDASVETIVGVDTQDPACELERTEFVRVGAEHALLRRIIRAAEIDTVIDTRLIDDSAVGSTRATHESNVIGTMNVLAACSGPGSPVRKLVFKSSALFYGCHQDDPAFFREQMGRPHPPQTPLERDIVDAERLVADFAAAGERRVVTALRFANALGPGVQGSQAAYLALPIVPTILGFDPRYQFVHPEDIIGCLQHAVRHELPGAYNCAGDGVLALSEVTDLLDRRALPVLPSWGSGVTASVLRRLGLKLTPEMLAQLRFGQGLDNRRLKAEGYHFRYTTRETVLQYAEHLRLRAVLGAGASPTFRYEQAVEDFVRRSRAVRARRSLELMGPEQIEQLRRALDACTAARAPSAPGDRPPDAGAAPEWAPASGEARATPAPGAHYEELDPEEILAVLPSLGREELEELHRHEAATGLRPEVLDAIEAMLGALRSSSASSGRSEGQ